MDINGRSWIDSAQSKDYQWALSAKLANDEFILHSDYKIQIAPLQL